MKRVYFARVVAGVCLAAHVGCAGASSVAGPDRVVFSSFRPSNWDIYYFAAPGAEPERLTDSPSLEYDPVFSPDGRWIVFTSERRGSPDLFAMSLGKKGAEPQLLIESGAMEDQAAFSPDGRDVAFVSTAGGSTDIYRIRFLPDRIQTVTNAENLTATTAGEFRPAYSPDGMRIAFSSDRDSSPRAHQFFPFARRREGEIYVMELERRTTSRLTHLAGWDGSPAWSADGRTIVFYSAGGNPRQLRPETGTVQGGFSIWAVPSAGGMPYAVSPGDTEALSPKFTKDGRLSFVTSFRPPGSEATWTVVSMPMNAAATLRPESQSVRDCWSPDYSAMTGAMVCHGPGPVTRADIMSRGFGEGPLLAPGFPIQTAMLERTLALYAMRHAFAVPPHPRRDLVVAQGEGDGRGQLLVATLDGNGAREIVRMSRPNEVPIAMSWSKDGDWITYTVGPFFGVAGAASDVWRVRSDGSMAVNLTKDSPANDGMSDFSGDGRRIVFRSARDGAFDLYLMNADGTNVRRLTNDSWKDTFPAWSPTADLVAFASDRDGTPDTSGVRDFEIYTLAIAADGSPAQLRRITFDPGQDAHPQFSPDGKWVIFTSERYGISDEEPLVQEVLFAAQMYGEIVAFRLADGLTVRLTHNKWEDGAPFWVGPTGAEDRR
jgi:TolB protein